MALDCLELAKKFYYRKKFAKAEKFLVQCVKNNNSDSAVFKYLGLTYICLKDYENAKRALRRYKEDDLEVLNALAFLSLKENQINHSIAYWLDILKIDKNYKLAKQNLDKIKNSKHKEELHKIASPEAFLFSKGFNLKNLWDQYAFAFWIVLSALVLVGIFYFFKPNWSGNKSSDYLPSVTLEKSNDYIRDNAQSMFKFSNRDVPYLFVKAKKYMSKRKYNSALILINKVLHSNLKGAVQEKFLMLKEFVPVPENWKDLKKKLKISNLVNFPTLYQGCYLSVDGEVTKVLKSKTMTKFFLETENGDKLIVTYPYAIEVKKNDKIRILGSFQYVQTPGDLIVVKGQKLWIKKETLVEL